MRKEPLEPRPGPSLGLTYCSSAVLAFFVASISPNMDTANAALPGIVTVYLFFTGYVIQ